MGVKGMFFTIDSLLASGIIIVSILLISNFYISQPDKVNVNYAAHDMVRAFSSMKVGEAKNDYVKSLIDSGEITNTNNSILEQIGELWADDKLNLSYNLTKNLSEEIIPDNFGFSVLVNGEEIYSRNKSVKRALVSSRKIISGIAKAKPTEGFTARVLLTGIKSKKTNAYAYFGGYEGDGNLTKRLVLPKDIASFNSSYLEVDAGATFNLYINNDFSGTYVKGSSGGGNMLADKWNISDVYLANFVPGTNTIGINFTGAGTPYIAGGFLRVAYTTASYNDTQTAGYEKYLFPGINGLVNLYSSVYVPGQLTNILVFLNYSSPYNMFLRFGNITVYENNGTKNATIANLTLATLLNFDSFNQKTVPLRLGITNATTLGTADAVLVSDVSGSMEWCSRAENDTYSGLQTLPILQTCFLAGSTWYWWFYNLTKPYNVGYSNFNKTIWINSTNDNRNVCSCRYHAQCIANDTRKIGLYINSSKLFVDTLSGVSGNKIGLVEFSSNYGSVYVNDCVGISPEKTIPYPDSIVRLNNLTTNKQQLVDKIDTTEAWWGTGTCHGINKAVELIESQNTPLRKKFIVLMSDGEATITCTQQPNSTAIADGVQAAWDACNKGISVYTIAFGADANITTMQRMNCSGGRSFNATNASKLEVVYKEIAGEIGKLSFVEQTLNVTGLAKSVVYADSYIEFNYSAPEAKFNRVPIGFETDRFGNSVSTGTLTIYANTSVSDAKVTSYSGTKWTDKLVINGATVYRLGDYGNDYTILGDPFAVNIPVSNINEGSNSITISTGLNITNSTGGSNDSRVIYTLLLNGFADYSSVVATADGCIWNVAFEDGSFLTISIPPASTETDPCSFTPSSIAYDANDALDNSVFQLFSNLDIDKDRKLDVNINENNIDVSTLTISKVPSLWGPAIIEI